MGNLAFGTQGSSYYDWARRGAIYCAYASVTAPVIYSTAAGTGGPLLWNNSNAGNQTVNAVILAVGVGVTTASTVASALGLTGNSGQSAAPTSTGAITAVANTSPGIGPATPACNTYSIGTVATAGGYFLPTHTLDTGALTTLMTSIAWVDIGGIVVVPPGSWCSVAAAATATTAVCKIGMIWVEIPVR